MHGIINDEFCVECIIMILVTFFILKLIVLVLSVKKNVISITHMQISNSQEQIEKNYLDIYSNVDFSIPQSENFQITIFSLYSSMQIAWGTRIVHECRYVPGTLAQKHEGNGLIRRQRQRCENNITIYCKEIGWKNVDWIHLVQNMISGRNLGTW